MTRSARTIDLNRVDPGFMARTAEALGFESFFCAEHPFVPVHTGIPARSAARVIPTGSST